MNIKRIFLDVDDVLVDFTLAVLSQLTGYKIGPVDFKPEWGFDIARAYNELSRPFEIHISPEQFWAKIPMEFWATRKKTEECDEIIRSSSELVGRQNVFLLTAPINDPECGSGKMELIRDIFPEFWNDRRYIIAPPKYVCAQPGSLLIDDSDRNVDAFREAGGIAVLFPRPWNSAHASQTNEFDFHK